MQEHSTHCSQFLPSFPTEPVLQTANMGTDLAAANTDLLVGTLQSSLEFWNRLPFNICFVGHALYATSAGGEFKDRWLLHLLLTFLWGNGGGVITCALLMRPEVVTWSFFQTDFIPASWIVCWWLMNWAPGGWPAKLMKVWWIQMLCKSCTMLSRAQLIVARVNLAVQLYPGVHTAPLILGTIAGCGGRLLADGIMTGWQSMPGFAELTSPGFVSRSAAFAAVSYYTIAYVAQLLPVEAAAGLVITGLMMHTIASDITGLPLDFTAAVTHLLHTLTFVPPPPPQPQPAPVTVLQKQVMPTKKGRPAAANSGNTPAKQSPAAAAAKAGTPSSAGKAKSKAAETTDNSTDVAQEQKRVGGSSSTAARRSTAAAADAGGVTTRRRAAAAAYA